MSSAQKLLSLYLICVLFSACSPRQEPASGLLWKITGTNGHVSYLFGTLHLYPEGRCRVSEQTMAALKASTILATERNVWDAEDQQFFRTHNRHTLVTRTYRVIEERYGSRLRSMEGELMHTAERHRIPVTGLETAQELLAILDQVPVPSEDHLSEEQIITRYEMSVDLYNSAHIDSVADVVLPQELGEETKRLMVDQRNLNWLDNIEDLINKERAFIAVGMGHLGGENGLVQLLRRKGYRVERVKN